MATERNGFEFVFKAEDLQRLLNEKPEKVVVSCYLADEVTKDGRKVGAMQVWANGYSGGEQMDGGGGGVPGCPVPPCNTK